jgi:UDP-glucose 4-epimerase
VTLAVVVGGSGFVGSHVADALSDRGYRVRIVDLKPSSYLRADQEMLIGDILDERNLVELLEGATYVYNFAGIADIEAARQRPLDTIRVNVLGNTCLLEACRRVGVRRVIYASTVYVYSLAGGFYRCSKQAAELYIEAYQQEYGLPYTILRFGSLYGPRADANNAVRRYLTQALLHGRIVCYGDGEEVREYIHVADAARSSVDILAPEFENEHVVLTGHQPMKVRALLETIQEILNRKIDIVFEPPDSTVHYRITPYNFHPRIGKKLVGRYYLDMGQGLLACLDEIDREARKS